MASTKQVIIGNVALLIVRLKYFMWTISVEPGQPKKAPFVLKSELTIIYPCFLKANQNHRIVQFEKGSVNILMEKDEKLKFRAIILLVYYYILRLKCEWEF